MGVGDVITAVMHVTHPIGNALGVCCTACGHQTRKHEALGFGLWECNKCGRRCHSIFSR